MIFLTQNSIVILVSLRLTLFPETDRVVFISDGRAVVADHETLMRENPDYRALLEAREEGRGVLRR